MIKKEVNEIRKQFNDKNCAITRICGCYVDGEKLKKLEFKEAFLSLPEEERFKYYELFRKTLGGTVGRNLLTLNFPMKEETEGGTQEFLYRLRESKLTDDELISEFYDKVIEHYEAPGNFLILLIHSVYDVPGKTSDGLEMDDASDEVFEHILCSICPVTLSKPGLSYNAEENSIHNRVQDWIVDKPEKGFLFPAFNERSTDIHATLYFSKDPNELMLSFVDSFLGCGLPLPANSQKETFQALIANTLGENCEYEVVKNIHERLNEMIEEHKDFPEPLTLSKPQVKELFYESGIEDEHLENFDRTYDMTVTKEDTELLAINVANTRSFEVKTPNVVIKVDPEFSYLVNTQMIDGRRCIVIEMGDNVEVNGIALNYTGNNEEI